MRERDRGKKDPQTKREKGKERKMNKKKETVR